MLAFPLILIASASATPGPAKCDAKPFTLAKPASAGKTAGPKGHQPKAEPAKPILKPSCSDPGHGQPGHKH